MVGGDGKRDNFWVLGEFDNGILAGVFLLS